MKYTLVYTHRAIKDIKKLQPDVRKRIGKTLMRYQSDPKLGTYRFRIGDYRVIFDLEENEIIILRVGHRSEIYRT